MGGREVSAAPRGNQKAPGATWKHGTPAARHMATTLSRSSKTAVSCLTSACLVGSDRTEASFAGSASFPLNALRSCSNGACTLSCKLADCGDTFVQMSTGAPDGAYHQFALKYQRVLRDKLGLQSPYLEQLASAQVDMAALAHYGQVIDAIRTRGMRPSVTVHHFASPLWVDAPVLLLARTPFQA